MAEVYRIKKLKWTGKFKQIHSRITSNLTSFSTYYIITKVSEGFELSFFNSSRNRFLEFCKTINEAKQIAEKNHQTKLKDMLIKIKMKDDPEVLNELYEENYGSI